MKERLNVAILGTGAWATALGCCASSNGHSTKLWGINQSEIDEINRGFNRLHFGNQKLFANLFASNRLKEVIIPSDVVVIAVPSLVIEEVLVKVVNCFQENAGELRNFSVDIVNVAKGFDPKTNDLWSKTIKRHLATCNFSTNLVSLIGPSFAIDVMKKRPTAINAVSSSFEASKRISQALGTDFFILKPIVDENGAQALSALKNFLAIVSGMMYEVFQSENTQAMVLTLGINEIRSFHKVFDFNEMTLFDLCGFGDILLTGTSSKSRNFSFGQRLITYNSVAQAMQYGGTVEGYNLYQIIEKLIKQNNLKTPIFQTLVDVLNGKLLPRASVDQIVKILHDN